MTISNLDVDAALRTEDVEGLIALGAPGDEYFPEAKEIASALSDLNENQLTKANIIAVIALVRARFFGLSSQDVGKRMQAFQNVARRLLQSL